VAGLDAALRARLDLGIDVRDDLLEDDVDLGAPIVALTGDLVQILAALLAEVNRRNLNAMDA
jgi:hypothetical protein